MQTFHNEFCHAIVSSIDLPICCLYRYLFVTVELSAEMCYMETNFGPKCWRLKKADKLTGIGTENSCITYRVGYRTVSIPAVFVIAGTISVDLLVAERTEIYKAKSAGRHITGHFRENTITKWQRRWNDEDRGSWTPRLIPDIRPWLGRKFGEVNFYVTQLLWGHWYSRKYLHKMGKAASPYCLYEEKGK